MRLTKRGERVVLVALMGSCLAPFVLIGYLFMIQLQKGL